MAAAAVQPCASPAAHWGHIQELVAADAGSQGNANSLGPECGPGQGDMRSAQGQSAEGAQAQVLSSALAEVCSPHCMQVFGALSGPALHGGRVLCERQPPGRVASSQDKSGAAACCSLLRRLQVRSCPCRACHELTLFVNPVKQVISVLGSCEGQLAQLTADTNMAMHCRIRLSSWTGAGA